MKKHFVVIINFMNLGQLEFVLDSITVDHNTLMNDPYSHKLEGPNPMTIEPNLNYNSNFIITQH
jgi:hypothetical protein